ncbi:MAG TPA: tRNA 2-thiocytidine(32) synthetase TtcA [Firmicutes bacterium]|nr:tRNA 2-thiocytidine(32) synthetase TtcA [Bacillota bacterium]
MDYLRTLLSSLRKADNDFSLIDDGDRIAVGLSGGKDSLTLLRLLSIYPKFSKKNFKVFPVFLDLGFEWNRDKLEPLRRYCNSLGMELHVEESTFVYEVLKANAKEGKHLPCSICSRMKKAGINRYAKEIGCNKVAFAHHSDDAVETLFMNMIHGGRVATFEPKMKLERANITFIRPLIYCREKDILALSKEEGMPVTDTCCPANRKTDREETKKLLFEIAKKYPESEENFRLSLTNYKPFCLYWNRFEFEAMEDPSIAIRPILNASDMRLSKRAAKKPRKNEENYLILKHHKLIGEFSLERKNKHHIVLFGIKGGKEETKIALGELLRREVKLVNPLKVEIEGNKALALSFSMLPSFDSKRRYYKNFLHFK